MEQQEILVQVAIRAWEIQVGRADKFFNSLKDDSFLKEIAPGKNRVIYLLGHLIAVNDNMISLFGFGNRSYAHYDEPFVKNPDNASADFPKVSDLKNEWKKSNEALNALFKKMTIPTTAKA